MLRFLILTALFLVGGPLPRAVAQEPPPLNFPNGFTIADGNGVPLPGNIQFNAQAAPGGFTFQATQGEKVLETGTAVQLLTGVYSYRTERSQGLILWNYQEKRYEIIRLIQDKEYPDRTLLPNK